MQAGFQRGVWDGEMAGRELLSPVGEHIVRVSLATFGSQRLVMIIGGSVGHFIRNKMLSVRA